jgi:hypothetical protein
MASQIATKRFSVSASTSCHPRRGSGRRPASTRRTARRSSRRNSEPVNVQALTDANEGAEGLASARSPHLPNAGIYIDANMPVDRHRRGRGHGRHVRPRARREVGRPLAVRGPLRTRVLSRCSPARSRFASKPIRTLPSSCATARASRSRRAPAWPPGRHQGGLGQLLAAALEGRIRSRNRPGAAQTARATADTSGVIDVAELISGRPSTDPAYRRAKYMERKGGDVRQFVCVVCETEFERERKPGRPPTVCSPECRAEDNRRRAKGWYHANPARAAEQPSRTAPRTRPEQRRLLRRQPRPRDPALSRLRARAGP